MADKYAAKWKAHLDHSEAYLGRGMDEQPTVKPARKRKAAA